MLWNYQLVTGIFPKGASLETIVDGKCNEDIAKALIPWQQRAPRGSIIMLDVGQKIEQKGKAADFVHLVTFILIKADKTEGFKTFLEGRFAGTGIEEITIAEMPLLLFKGNRLAMMKASELQALVADFAVSQYGTD